MKVLLKLLEVGTVFMYLGKSYKVSGGVNIEKAQRECMPKLGGKFQTDDKLAQYIDEDEEVEVV